MTEIEQLKHVVKTLGEAMLEHADLQNKRTAEFSNMLSELKENMMVGDVPRNVAEHITHQIGGLFQNQVVLDSLASALLHSMQGALVHKAETSKQRAPQLLVLDHYFPKSLRAVLTEEGQLTIWQQLDGSVGENEGWEVHEVFNQYPDLADNMRQLLASYNADADRFYYVIDDVTLQTAREEINERIMPDLMQGKVPEDAQPIPAPQAESAPEEAPATEDFVDFEAPAQEAPQGTAMDRLRSQLSSL